jgi:neutral ceramidase
MTTPWLAGFGTASITTYDPELCMFGWGHPRHVAKGVAMPLFARTLVLEERATKQRLVYVACDLGMISESVRQAVAKRVCTPENGLTDHDLVLTATHTHAAPGGFSTYLFYAISIPGVSQHIHDTIVEGVVASIEKALAALVPARAWTHAGWIPTSEPVAFNRSLAAYNRNEDATPVTWERRDEAVDRTMTVLRVDDEHDQPLGLVSWFAVHGTSLHWQQNQLHGDNKGCAAQACEAWAREQGRGNFVALFAQESAGDVSPNYRWHERRHLMIGRYDDDLDSAEFNGAIQARHARALWSLARSEGVELQGPLTTALRYRDFFNLTADAEFARVRNARTTTPRLGLAFSLGTLEGQGPFFKLRRLFPLLTKLQALNRSRERTPSWKAPHGVKVPFWDFGKGADNKVLGRLPALNPLLHLFTDRFVAYYREALAYRGAKDVSWVPRYLPIQQVRIGSLVVAGLPTEPTTVAGRRLRSTLRTAWSAQNISHVVVTGYANAYVSYLTTPEEYEEQDYEGASNLYGQWSLPVYCSELRDLTRTILRGEAHRDLGEPPPHFPLSWCMPAPGFHRAAE